MKNPALSSYHPQVDNINLDTAVSSGVGMTGEQSSHRQLLVRLSSSGSHSPGYAALPVFIEPMALRAKVVTCLVFGT